MDFKLFEIVHSKLAFLTCKSFVAVVKFNMTYSVAWVAVDKYALRTFVTFSAIDGADLNGHSIPCSFFFDDKNWILSFGGHCIVNSNLIHGEVECFITDIWNIVERACEGTIQTTAHALRVHIRCCSSLGMHVILVTFASRPRSQINFLFRSSSPEIPMCAFHVLIQKVETIYAVVTESTSVSTITAMSLNVT